MQIHHFCALFAPNQLVAHRVHQVRFPQPNATVDKQRVVGPTGVFRNLSRRGQGQLVRFALDEILEHEFVVEVAAMVNAALDIVSIKLCARRRKRVSLFLPRGR